MVVRFENLWISIPLMLIPISFAIIMMGLVRVWMFSAPTKIRRKPKYSLHVMRDQKEPLNYGTKTKDNIRRINSYSDDPNAASFDEGRIEKVLRPSTSDEYPRQMMVPPRQSSSGFATPASGYSYNYGRKGDEHQALTEAKFV